RPGAAAGRGTLGQPPAGRLGGRGDVAARAPRPGPRVSERLDLSYVVPIRWRDGEQRDGLAAYLAAIRPHCAETIVVDGSAAAVFAANGAAFGEGVAHVPPDEGERCLMGKVSGVRTGVRLAGCERVVIADDDVRYEP